MTSLDDYDYHLPEELIAQHPLPERDSARLLLVNRATGEIEHRHVRDVPEILSGGDCLVVNDTRVIPARLRGVRTATGGGWEGLFLEALPSGEWRMMSQTRGKLTPGELVTLQAAGPCPVGSVGTQPDGFGEELRLKLIEREPDGIWRAAPESTESALDVLQRFGSVPLPPYITREELLDADRDRYQTVFSKTPGAIAAPTAGLHFTPELLSRCGEMGISQAAVTLHVGIGTFRPLTVEHFEQGKLHSEWCEVSTETSDTLNAVRQAGGRIIAVGTTSTRTLQSTVVDGVFQGTSRRTDLFIRPPYEFTAIDGLLTNFHLPRSSLLVLVSALMGLDLMQRVYATAVRERYRFFSYGDAMLIL